MAKLVVDPPANLEHRDSDVELPAERLLQFSLFTRLARKPTIERSPGTLKLRRYRQGEVICRQGESGWTAFYVLTTEDMLALRKEQVDENAAEEDKSALVSEISLLENRLGQMEGKVGDHPLRGAATVHLAIARPTRPSLGSLLSRLMASIRGRPAHTPDRRPLYIPIDAPTNLAYDSRQASLYEGDLFGEQSCIYGTPRSATIVADRDCYVLEMLRNILDQIKKDKAYQTEMDAVYKERILKNHLRNLPLFSELTDEQFAQLQGRVDLIRLKDGQIIYDEHDRSDGMYLIRDGLVKVMKNVSYLLVEEDVLDWPKLLAFVRGDSASSSASVRHLHELLPEALRKDAAVDRRAEVLDALNAIIKHPQLPEAAPVQALSSAALTELVSGLPAKRGEWSELDRRRFNRLLLEAACPGVLRSRQRPVGQEMTLAYLGQGEFLGEMGLLDHKPRSATCIAYVHPRPKDDDPTAARRRREAEYVELVHISAKLFQELTQASPSLRAKLEQEAAVRRQRDAKRVQAPDAAASKAMLLEGQAWTLGLIQGQKLMLIDLDRCTRCDECVQACVNTHSDGRSRLFLDGDRFGKYLVPTTCRACLNPVCMIGCPVGSIHRGDNQQIVIENWCIGCEVCAKNCPYGAIQMHDVGLIPESTHGWLYATEALAGPGWETMRYSTAHWLAGKSPFHHDRAFGDSLAQRGTSAERALCFRYEFRLDAHRLQSTQTFKLEVTSADEQATVWINGREVAKPEEKPKHGKREYLLSREKNLFRAGRNVLAVKVTPPPAASAKQAVLLKLRLDEVPVPDVPLGMRESVELSEKLVTDVAVVCDQCSSQLGQRPACVTACPHDAAMRVDARFNFPDS